ncbi:MAG TPA: FAD-binding oxidoreductase [Candidatus Limnocylindrales bacterium]
MARGEASPYRLQSFWQATMPALPDGRGRPLPARADVVVIGGGYTGLGAALRLARCGAAVTLLEAETLGWGASTRNGGMAHGGLKWGRATLRRRYGPELGERLHLAGIEAFGVFERVLADEALECDYRRSGQLVLAWSRGHAADLEAEAIERVEDGLPAHVVRGPALAEEIGTRAYPAGLVEEMAGGLHPGRYTAGLVDRAAAAGVDLHEGRPATGIERLAGRLRVRTPDGAIEADEVVLATNGYTPRLVPWVSARVIPIGSYIVVTEPLDPAVAAAISPRGRMFFDTKNFLYYWRLTPDGRLLFGGRASFAPTTVERTAAILEQAMRQVHPQVRDARIEYAWGGNVGFTFDRLPHLGRRDGVTYALGYCGSGVCMATYFGTLVAAMLGRGSERAAERSPFEEIRHPGAPLPGIYRGDPWFLPLVGEAFRLQDRVDRRR